MAKHKKNKNKKNIPYRSSGVVKYGSESKYVLIMVLIVLLILLSPFIIQLINGEHIENEIFIMICLILLPCLIITTFCFRFCVKYDIKTREIQYRNFFKFRTIHFRDIKKVYRKSDSRTTFLVIKTDRKKIGINMCACNGAREFSFFLKRHIPKAFEE